MAAVLTVVGSLTKFLERHYNIFLTVNLHDQFLDKTDAEESRLLGCDPGAPCLRRQVSLMHRNTALFDAEPVLPLDTIPTDLMQALEAGREPLGNLLMDRGLSLSRSDLSVARIAVGEGAARVLRWSRRSVLRSPSGTRALVVECFHDVMWSRLHAAVDRRGK